MGNALAWEHSTHMKSSVSNENGCNSGAMVGITWRLGIDREAVDYFDLVTPLLSPANVDSQGIGRQATYPKYPLRNR